jgi:hypothetical protein
MGLEETVVLFSFLFSSSVVGFCSFGEPSQGAPGCWGFWARGPVFISVSWS